MGKFRVRVDETCIGCNACVEVCSENFKLGEGNASVPKSVPIKETIDDSELEKNKEAEEICPVNAIKIDKVKD